MLMAVLAQPALTKPKALAIIFDLYMAKMSAHMQSLVKLGEPRFFWAIYAMLR